MPACVELATETSTAATSALSLITLSIEAAQAEPGTEEGATVLLTISKD